MDVSDHSAAEAARLQALAAYGLLDSNAEPHLDAIVRAASSHAETVASTITLVDHDRQWFKARVGIDAAETGLDASICNVAMRADGDTFVVPDASRDERFAHMPGIADGMGIRYYAGAQLRTREGEPLGMLCVIDTQPREGASADELEVLTRLARRTMAAFELRRDLIASRTYAGNRQLLTEARDLLERATIALDLAEQDVASAQLDQTIALVEAQLGLN